MHLILGIEIVESRMMTYNVHKLNSKISLKVLLLNPIRFVPVNNLKVHKKYISKAKVHNTLHPRQTLFQIYFPFRNLFIFQFHHSYKTHCCWVEKHFIGLGMVLSNVQITKFKHSNFKSILYVFIKCRFTYLYLCVLSSHFIYSLLPACVYCYNLHIEAVLVCFI